MEEVEPEGSADAPRVSPGEIAYREFARVADGFDEGEVRAFLHEIADVVSAAREREQRLEGEVAELEERVKAAGSPARGDDPDPRAEALFAQLREAPAGPEPPAPKRATPARAPKTKDAGGDAAAPATDAATAIPDPAGDGGEEATRQNAAATGEAGPEPEPTEDDRVRTRRDAQLEPLLDDLVRAAKRLLQDEQNVLLDAARRARARVEPERLLPEPAHHREAWAAVLTPAVDAAYGGGRSAGSHTRKSASAPERIVSELSASLIAPLRERLTATLGTVIAQGPYESPAELHRELASAVSARYREWRASELETRLGDALAAAYTRGSYDGAPSGAQLRWVSDPVKGCPDCEDNSLEPTVKGQHFPTGQPHPPAHPGCRCLVIALSSPRGE